MTAPRETEIRLSQAIFYAGTLGGAVALTVLALALAAIDRGEPFAWLDGRSAMWILAVIVAAPVVGMTKWAVEWWRGAKLLQPGGAVASFALAIVLFQLAHLLASLALGLAVTILLVAGSPVAPLPTRALLLLLVGGVWLAFAASLLRDLLLLARLR
ncbi:MAG TPA: hypothetical protein VF693_03135 [Allosphingosinicella sp.]|jgi:hypothetical protein